MCRLNRLAACDALMVDAEPPTLAIALVNPCHAVKYAGLIYPARSASQGSSGQVLR